MFEDIALKGNFILSSGRKSNIFYDFHLLSPHDTFKFTEDLHHLVQENGIDDFDFIASPAIGGIIPGYLFSLFTAKPLVIIDKKGNIRGKPVGENYICVDDVYTGGQAVANVEDALLNYNRVASAVYIFRGTELPDDLIFLEQKESELDKER